MNPLRIGNNYFDGTRYNRAWVLGDIFFSAGCFFSQEFISMLFSSKPACRTFVSEVTHNPLKCQMVGP